MHIKTYRRLPFAPNGFSIYIGRLCGGKFGINAFRYTA